MADEPTLSKGISSEWVTYLQQLLAYAGYWQGGETGEFDDQLEQAVIAYQSAMGLPADGQVGQSTWDALTGASSSSSSSSSSPAYGGGDDGTITVPADLIQGLNPENYPELSALLYSSDFDEYLRNYAGIDPSVFADEGEPVA